VATVTVVVAGPLLRLRVLGLNVMVGLGAPELLDSDTLPVNPFRGETFTPKVVEAPAARLTSEIGPMVMSGEAGTGTTVTKTVLF
jgi:hypothetical protein